MSVLYCSPALGSNWLRPSEVIGDARLLDGGVSMTVHVFTGPTLSGDEVVDRVDGEMVYPPVEHGDLLSLDIRTGDIVVIIDGYYHQRAPGGHKEVLQLLERGIAVVGCASMGALRAAELAAYG